jgi:hypothetical protein
MKANAMSCPNDFVDYALALLDWHILRENESHQALEKAIKMLVEGNDSHKAPASQEELLCVLGILEAWHEDGLMSEPAEKSPAPGALLLQTALMAGNAQWITVLAQHVDSVARLAMDENFSRVAHFSRNHGTAMPAYAIQALWEAALQSSSSGLDLRTASGKLRRLAHLWEAWEKDSNVDLAQYEVPLSAVAQAARGAGMDIDTLPRDMDVYRLVRRVALQDHVTEAAGARPSARKAF